MSKMLFSRETINASLEMILFADRWYKLEIKGGGVFSDRNTHKMSSEKAKNIFIQKWAAVDWTSRESILPFVEYIERAYAKTPRSHNSPHHYFDGLLFKDGYRMRDGRLRRIVNSSSSN